MTKISNQYSLTNILTADLANSRLGINNVSPTVALDVTGAGKFSGILTLGSTISNGTYAYTLPSATGTLALTSALSGTTNYVAKFTSSTGIGNSAIQEVSGNLGLGVTPSAWNGIYKVAEIGTAAIFGTSSYNSAAFSTNVFYNASNSPRYIASDFSNMYWQDDGQHLWYNAPSGTAGNAITFTQAMTLTAAGNLGIGTSSPSQVLDVRKATASGDTQFNFLNSQNSSAGNTSVTSTIYLGFCDDSGGVANVNKIVSGKSGDYTSAPNASSFLAFHTTSANTSAERMRITSGGQVQIGTTSGTIMSTIGLVVEENIVSKGTLAGIFTQNRPSTNFFGFYGSTNFIVYNSNVGTIGSFNATSGAYAGVSDVNKKKDFEPSQVGLNEVLGLKPTLYRMKTEDDTQDKHLGFIAQEVKEFIPQAYSETGEGDDKFIGLTEMPIIAALTKAIQELSAENTSLINRIEALENK